MRQITYQDIMSMDPCSSHRPSKYIPVTWTGTILDILKLPNVAPTEKLWVAYRVLDDKTLRLFAVACARRALSRVENLDVRSLIAVNLAEAYAHGRCTAEELSAAKQGAYAAAADAHAAAAAAAAAAYADAHAAAAAYADAHAAAAAAAYAYADAHAAAAAAAAYAYAHAADAADAAADAADAHAAAAAAYADAYAYTDAGVRKQRYETQIVELVKLIEELGL